MGFHRFCINAGKMFFRIEQIAPCIRSLNAKDEKITMLHIIGQYGIAIIVFSVAS
jgi:hypothetical protein